MENMEAELSSIPTGKRVAIFTTFSSADAAYSLNRVVQDQIKMLVFNGYRPLVLVAEGFTPKEAYALPGVSLFHLPTVTVSNDGQLPPTWGEEVQAMRAALKEALKDTDVVITHDIISQPAALIHNLAARIVVQDFPHMRWLHWVHSVFSSNMPSNIMEASKKGRERFPNSYLVYPNSWDIPRLARNFAYEETQIKHCPHPTDVEEFYSMHEVSRRFVRYYDVLSADAVLVYPCRLDRGKQPHLLVELAGALKRLGKSVRAIIMDFHSTGGDKVDYRNGMKEQMRELGLTDREMIFFSEFDKRYEYEAPQQVVKDLMMVSNVFLMPSRSETYSLVTQEAILCGNFVLLNQDFPPFRSIFGDLPKYYQFSSNVNLNGYDGSTNTQYNEGAERYFDDIARYIGYILTHDRSIALRTQIRQTRNLKAVFDNYFLPLLYVD
jgi:hypothetical protein